MSHNIFKQLANALIRLRVCAGWSEHLLVAHTTLLGISCHSSFGVKFYLALMTVKQNRQNMRRQKNSFEFSYTISINGICIVEKLLSGRICSIEDEQRL